MHLRGGSYTASGAATPLILADQVTWRPNGPLATIRFGDGFTQVRSYDASYRLTGLADASATVTLRNLAYGYDSRDNMTSASDLLNAANSESFTFTPRDSLSGATGPYGSYGFSYDGVGNRVSHTTPSGVEAYVYPSTSNRLASVNSSAPARAFTYDANGSVVTDTRGALVYGYAYDTAGRMASVSLNGVVQASYTYDWKGQQAVRRFPASGQAIQSVFDSAGHRIAEYSEGTGALIRAYVWMGDMPVAVVEGGQVYYVRVDHIGRPAFATTSAGTVIWTAQYLPFGGVHVTTGAPIDFRFPGQWFQAEAGLYQNWMRDYDPTTGRYVEADPLGLVDGASVYGYVGQSPQRNVDPRGEEWTYYTLPDGNTGMSWQPGGSTYCPSGDCKTKSPTENIRDPWPEFDQCVKTCLDSEPFLDINSWWPVSQSTRAQCAIVMGIANSLVRGGWTGRAASKILSPGCRRDMCEERCVSTCEP